MLPGPGPAQQGPQEGQQEAEQAGGSPSRPGGRVQAKKDPLPTFDLTIRTLAGSVLATLPEANLAITRGDIIPKLIQVSPLAPTHIYDLVAGEEPLRGGTTLADRGLTCEPGGTIELTAIVTENSLYQVYLDALESIGSLNRDLQELKCLRSPPAIAQSTVQTALAVLGLPTDDWKTMAQRLGEPFKTAITGFHPETAPHRSAKILKDYCTDVTFDPARVATVSLAARKISEWLHALHNLSLSIC